MASPWPDVWWPCGFVCRRDRPDVGMAAFWRDPRPPLACPGLGTLLRRRCVDLFGSWCQDFVLDASRNFTFIVRLDGQRCRHRIRPIECCPECAGRGRRLRTRRCSRAGACQACVLGGCYLVNFGVGLGLGRASTGVRKVTKCDGYIVSVRATSSGGGQHEWDGVSTAVGHCSIGSQEYCGLVLPYRNGEGGAFSGA